MFVPPAGDATESRRCRVHVVGMAADNVRSKAEIVDVLNRSAGDSVGVEGSIRGIARITGTIFRRLVRREGTANPPSTHH